MRVGDDDPRASTRRMQAPPELRGSRGPGAERPPPNGGTSRGRGPRRQGALAWWGTLSGGRGIAIVLGSVAFGALLTIVLRRDPGFVLGMLLILATIVAGLAVRTNAARLIIPAPTLCYVPAATIAGAINDRAADTSKIGLILHGGKWISSGFVAMALATVFAIVIWGLRLLLELRTKPRSLGRPSGSRGPSGGRDPSKGRELARQAQRRDDTGPYRQRRGEDFDGATRPGGPVGPTGPGPTGPGPTGPGPTGPGPTGPGAIGPGPTAAPGPAGPAVPIGPGGANGPGGATGPRRGPTFTPKPEPGPATGTRSGNGTRPSPGPRRPGTAPYPGYPDAAGQQPRRS